MRSLDGSGRGVDPCDERNAAAGLAQLKNSAFMLLPTSKLSNMPIIVEFNPYKAQLNISEAVI